MTSNFFSVIKMVAVVSVVLTGSCQPSEEDHASSVHLVTLDPGHFHAALVQKSMYGNVDSTVNVYAPAGPDVQLHLNRIKAFNSRIENPTHWKEEVYTGGDFLEKMIEEKKGNVVVLAGNNQKKTEYILKSLEAGFHVLADKPMAINSKDFLLLQRAFETSKQKNLLLYDIMTERFEITTMLQKEFSRLPEIFGTLEKGTPDDPAVIQKSVHYFYKHVSGSVLTRPAWFMDMKQEGEGIVDVATHLVDLVQWECFPEQIIHYASDVVIINSRHWSTDMTLDEFKLITQLDHFPEYLKGNVSNDTVLKVFCNGEINYRLRGVCARVSVSWDYRAQDETGDTHYSILCGTKANLIIRQGVDEKYQPTLYIEPRVTNQSYEVALMQQFKKTQVRYPGIGLKKAKKGWEVTIPDRYKEGHEAHFARVMQYFLEYLEKGNMPDWEVPNMLAKYYTTTGAFELAHTP